MEKLMLETLREQQREYFASGATLPVKAQMKALSRLEMALQKQEQILCKALHTDLGKSKTESVMCGSGAGGNFSTGICCRCFRRTGGKSGTFTGKI